MRASGWWVLAGLVAWTGCAADEETSGDATTPPAVTVASVQGGYTEGGVLGRYVAGLAAAPDDLPGGAPFLVRIEESLDFKAGDADFGALADGGGFVATYTGGMHVAEGGTWRVGLTVAGGAVLRLGGETIVDAWDAPEVTTALTRVGVEPGWVPLEVVYRRLPLATHLQVWGGPEGELVEPLGGEALGWPTEPPAGEPALAGTATLGAVTPYRADVHVECTSPARLSVAIDGPNKGAVMVDTLAHAHDVSVPLSPDATHTLRVTLTDLWGRTAELPALTAKTPGIPDYTPGGLLGRYYQGKAFDTEVAVRVDAGIDLPSDGDTGGAYGMPMESDNFSVRWEGGVDIGKAGEWTFHAGGDDGQRLWVDGVPVADLWTDHGFTIVSGTLTMEKGWHTLLMEHYEGGGAAQVRLEWEGPGTARQVIPGGKLGWVMPSGLAGAPTITGLQAASGPQADRVRAIWFTKALSRCAAKVGGVETAASLATGFALDLSGLGAGATDVVVACTAPDGTGKQSADISVYLPAPPTGAVVLDDFGGEALADGWKVIDEVADHGAKLELKDGALIVSGNPGEEGEAGALPNAGLIAWLTGDQRGEGELHTHVWVGDGGSVGLLIAVKDADSWVRADVSPAAGIARFVRSQESGVTELGRTEPVDIQQQSWVGVSLKREGDSLTLRIDGADVLTVTEPDLPEGLSGIYVWRSDNARFDHLSFTK